MGSATKGSEAVSFQLDVKRSFVPSFHHMAEEQRLTTTTTAAAFTLSSKKRIRILYTGGTMGMKPNQDGSLEPVPGYLTEQVKDTPELHRDEMPQFDIQEYSPLLDSSAMGPSDWVRIATDVEEHYYEYDGFVVIMGTDTMAYASSALSFMLENLGKTVVFTGSQIPFSEVYNDARRNLVVSLMMAMQEDFPEVCICFNDTVFRANRCVKVNSRDLEAYESPNFPALARLGVYTTQRLDLALPQPKAPFRVHKTLSSNIIVIKLTPGFDDETLLIIANHSKNLRAVVFEMYGAGNAPAELKGDFIKALKTFQERGVICVAVSQCLRGGVKLEMYSLGSAFANVGVLSAGDMTTEACVTKIAYLFGRGADNETVGQFLGTSIRGELTEDSLDTKYRVHSTELLSGTANGRKRPKL